MAKPLERKGIGERVPHLFEYEPNRRNSAFLPLRIHRGMSIQCVPDITPYLLNEYYVVTPEQSFQPLSYYSPKMKVPYPSINDSQLRIAAYTVMSGDMPSVRPSLMMVVSLVNDFGQLIYKQDPPTVSRVGLIGNLLFPPTYDSRGPVYNFGVPRAIRIYSVDGWNKPFSLENLPPHPRDWNLIYEDTDVRGLWGWNYLDFPPCRTSHLIFMFSHLPKLPKNIIDMKSLPSYAQEAEANKIPWHYRGISIERLAIFRYEDILYQDKVAEFVPVTSWNNKYENQPNPFTSKYWAVNGVTTVEQHKHQSHGQHALKHI